MSKRFDYCGKHRGSPQGSTRHGPVLAGPLPCAALARTVRGCAPDSGRSQRGCLTCAATNVARADSVRMAYPSLGSNASRRALPSRLDASTVTKMHTPGRKTSHGECAKYCCALLSKLPQLGVGGWMPKPR